MRVLEYTRVHVQVRTHVCMFTYSHASIQLTRKQYCSVHYLSKESRLLEHVGRTIQLSMGSLPPTSSAFHLQF